MRVYYGLTHVPTSIVGSAGLLFFSSIVFTVQ